MAFVFFIYGLAFFAMGLAVALESRRASALPLGHHLPWLAAFGFVHSLVEWSDMFLLGDLPGPAHDALLTARTVLLPLSTLLLIRFGIGLVGEAGPLPDWLTFAPIVLLVPAGLLVAYALIVTAVEPPLEMATDIWSRYLLYLPGSLLSSFGFIRQWRGLPGAGLGAGRNVMLGAALAFLFNALVAGLVVPPAPYGLAPWLNYERLLAFTGVPVQVWRALSAVAVTVFVVRALGVFEAEREQEMAELREKREQAQRAALQAQSEARQTAEDWTNGLVSISRRVANLESVDSVLAAIVDLARRLIHADTCALGLWNESGTQLELKCVSTATETTTTASISVEVPLILDVVRAGRACRFPEDVDAGYGRWDCPVIKQEIRAAAIVPLELDERPIGGLWVTRTKVLNGLSNGIKEADQPFTPADLVGLEHLADQAVIALEHALMAANLQSLAVIEERSRIAREMHDGLAQILGYLSLEMQTLEALVQQEDREQVLAELRQARQRINAAQADVRESILSLRTTLAGDVARCALIPALQQYVEEFGVQTGIEATLVADVDDVSRLSPLAETQLVRVVQEALANVRKHAQARQVEVRLSRLKVGSERERPTDYNGSAKDAYLFVTVADDGVGINGQSDSGHFGLQMMRERAESVGGGLRITSRPGEGTQVELWLPLVHEPVVSGQ